MDMQKIYKIRTEGDVEGKTVQTIGYATGDIEDIRMYYDDRKYYNLDVEEINVIHVKLESVSKRKKLLRGKASLEKRLEEIQDLTKQ